MFLVFFVFVFLLIFCFFTLIFYVKSGLITYIPFLPSFLVWQQVWTMGLRYGSKHSKPKLYQKSWQISHESQILDVNYFLHSNAFLDA